MAETSNPAHVDLSALLIDYDEEALPTLAVGARAAEPPVQAYRDAIRKSYEEYTNGTIKTPPRFMVPVLRSEVSTRESKRKDKDGKDIVSKWEQHPNLTGVINRLRKAAEAEGLGVRIVVDYQDADAHGVRKLKINKGKDGQPDTVRLRFVGINRKTRKDSKDDAKSPAA